MSNRTLPRLYESLLARSGNLERDEKLKCRGYSGRSKQRNAACRMRLNNCIARLSECVFEMAQSSKSSRQKVLNAFTKQFGGLCASDFPPELAPQFDEIFGEMKDKLLPLVPGNYRASLGTMSSRDAIQIIKKICSLYIEVSEYESHHRVEKVSAAARRKS
jgi:hypothetical protein